MELDKKKKNAPLKETEAKEAKHRNNSVVICFFSMNKMYGSETFEGATSHAPPKIKIIWHSLMASYFFTAISRAYLICRAQICKAEWKCLF